MDSNLMETRQLLRPDVAEEMKHNIDSAEAKLTDKHIEDKGAVRRQLLRLRKTYDEQRPKEFATGQEEGEAERLSRKLLEEIIQDGMCSQAEMRAAPPGAVDKHRRWEARNKQKILAWKNLQLRLRPGEQEAANLERYRPTASSLNLDNPFVQRAQLFNVENVSGTVVTLNDKELDALRAISPEVAEAVGSMSNAERALAKQLIAGFVTK